MFNKIKMIVEIQNKIYFSHLMRAHCLTALKYLGKFLTNTRNSYKHRQKTNYWTKLEMRFIDW